MLSCIENHLSDAWQWCQPSIQIVADRDDAP